MALLLAACGTAEAPTPAPTQTPAGPTPTPMEGEATPTPADPDFDAEAYFQSRTIRILAGFNPGGGTDTHSRFLAANLGRFIPGNPTFVVSNLTPNVAAQNFVWSSEPDGLTSSYSPTPLIQTAEEPAGRGNRGRRRAGQQGTTPGRANVPGFRRSPE